MKSAEPTSWFVYGKFKVDNSAPDQVMEVTARQWEWRMRYGDPSNVSPINSRDWAEHPQVDDLHGVNEVHTWKDANVRIYLKTLDVIHSFFLPNMRLKQDALPGRTIVIWFRSIEANCKFENGKTVPLDVAEWKPGADPWASSKNQWELACAELCGPRHYAMRGRLFVHESKEDFLKWLEHKKAEETRRTPEETRTAIKTDK